MLYREQAELDELTEKIESLLAEVQAELDKLEEGKDIQNVGPTPQVEPPESDAR